MFAEIQEDLRGLTINSVPVHLKTQVPECSAWTGLLFGRDGYQIIFT